MAEEIYIRFLNDDIARGPYNDDQLLTLVEAGKITPETLFFDQLTESWMPIHSHEEVNKRVFPKKKKLSLRAAEAKEAPENPTNSTGGKDRVDVQDLLAASEGNTPETRHVQEKARWRERTANLAIPTLTAMLVISALSVLYPAWNIIDALIDQKEGSLQALFQQPVVFLGALDLIMAVLLLLNATEIFPLIRFRAMLGSGFFSVLYFSNFLNGDPAGFWMAFATLAFGLGLFVCTLTLNFFRMLLSATLGIIGSLGIAWFSNLVPLFFS